MEVDMEAKNKPHLLLRCILSFLPQDHAVTSVPLVTMATQSNLAGSASRASAAATLTPRTLTHVTPGLANVSSACTTLTAHPVTIVNSVTMAMLWPMTADVSEDGIILTILIQLLFS